MNMVGIALDSPEELAVLSLLAAAGRCILYQDAVAAARAVAQVARIDPDDKYGKPLAGKMALAMDAMRPPDAAGADMTEQLVRWAQQAMKE